MRSASTLAPIALLAGVFACASPAPPVAAPPAPSYVAPALAPTIAPPPLARWVETGSFNDVGPKTKDGTAIVLGGRRGLITADGTLRVPATPGPEPIEELIEVPTPSGARLVGRGVSTIYSFTDILAEPKVLARSATRYVNIDPGPGMVAAWGGVSARPTYVDVETGRETHLGAPTVLPVRSLSFVDAKKGAAIFAIAGLATTTDGGATWAPIIDADGGAFMAKRLSPRDGLIEARIEDDGSERQVDPVASTLGDPTPHRTPGADASAIERWLARTHRDPLEVAVSDGIAMSSGNALVASQGFVAKVDLVTGSILELVDLGDQFAAHTCTIGRGGGKAWVACVQDTRTTSIRLTSFPLGDGPLEAAPPQSIGTSTDLRWSASGGVLMLGPCQSGGDGNACVLQPDGKWRTLDVPHESSNFTDTSGYGGGYYGSYGYGTPPQATPVAYGIGPLGDGGVAYLTNFHDDTPPDDDAGDAAAPANSYGYYNGYYGYAPPKPPKIQLVVIEGNGMHRRLPPFDFSEMKSTQLRFGGNLEEDVDHTLRMVFQDAEGPMLVVQPPSGASTITRIEGAKNARIHGARGIAIGAAALLTSNDGGATWAELPTPPHVLTSTTGGLSSTLSAAEFEASDVGFHIGGHLRIGWGELDPSDATLSAPTPDVTPSPQVSARPPSRVVCTTSGKSDAPAIAMTTPDLDKLFGVTPAAAGTRRSSGRTNIALSPTTLFDIEGPEHATAPTKWRVHWLSSYDVGAHAHVWTGDAPKGAPWYATIVGSSGYGDRFFAIIRGDSRTWALRATSGGGGEIVEVPEVAGYYVATAIGAHASDPVAWLDAATLFALPAAGGGAVALASFGEADRPSLRLGNPSKGGVPLYANGDEWGAFRAFALPASTKRLATSGPSPVVPAALDAWIGAPEISSELYSAPGCDAKSHGIDYRLAGVTLPLEVDGTTEYSGSGGAIARISADGICLAGVAESAYASGGSSTPAGSGSGPVNFLRADFVGKRAEGGINGPLPHTRTFTCKVEN